MKTILLLCTLLFVAIEATHYRYGTWSYVPSGGRSTTHKIQQSWRRSFFGNVNIGNSIGVGSLLWGDSSSTNLNIQCTSVDLLNDIFSGEATLVHTYPSSGTAWTASWESCCRISTLRNNADNSQRMFITVNLGDYPTNRSPVANVLPIVPTPRGSPYCFQIAAADADNDPLTYRLATTAEFMGSTHPSGSSITSSGLYCWNNNALLDGLYNTAVVISDGKVSIMVDFLMNLTNVVAQNNPPVWDRPPTPVNGASFSVSVNNVVSFNIQCSDPDTGNTVSIQTGTIPTGSSLTTQSGSNPGSRTFSWSSSSPALAVVCFSCVDNVGASAGQTCAQIEFVGTCCDIHSGNPILNGVPSSITLQCGDSIPAAPTVTASFVCPENSPPVTVTPSVTDVGNACNRVITRTWSFTDSCGRTTSATQTITIRDTQAPALVTPGARTLNCGVDSTSTSNTGTATATDNCDNSVSISFIDSSFSSACLSTARINRVWTATDDCANTATGTQVLTIVDNTAPTLTVPADVTLECAVDSSDPSNTGIASASDSCDASVTPTYSDSIAPSSCLAVGTITRTWSVSDDCGNSVSKNQIITYQDTTAPSTSADSVCLSPPNGQYWCFPVSNPDFIHFSDACTTPTLSYNDDCVDNHGSSSGCRRSGNDLCLKASTDHTTDTTYTFSFNIQDACGNTATQVATVTVPNTATSGCRQPTVCINDCPEERCKNQLYDLVTENTNQVVGFVRVNNKLDYELQVEVVTFEGSIPDRGWWMFGLAIGAGSERVQKTFGSHSAQSRWYATIDLNRAFSSGHACGDKIDFFVAALVSNDKRNSNPPTERAFIRLQGKNKRSITERTNSGLNFVLPSNIGDYTVKYRICCECTFRTQTQNDYGNLCYAPLTRTSQNARVREIACYENNFWTWSANWCFPNGLQIGCSGGYTATWTNPTAAATYWADETSPAVLTRDWVNPPNRALGYLAAETAALALNVRFDTCDADWSTSCNRLEDLRVCRHPNSVRNECQPWWGNTISQILAEANSVVGGCSSGNPNALFECVRYINRAFVDGKRLWEAADFTVEQSCPN